MMSISRKELLHRIALTMVPDIGPVTARRLIKHFESARVVFKQPAEQLLRIEGVGLKISQAIRQPGLLDKAAKEMKFLERHRILVVCLGESGYPEPLEQCHDAPVLMYTKGEYGLTFRRSLSVVGTRRATSYGRDLCRQIVLDLAGKVKDLVIVSGLAFGIDVIAHKAALEAGIPTLAVLGHGFNTIYPSAHREVAKRIMRQGALITDFHSTMGPERNNFLRRNRIIAGFSNATLVIESADTGGALITADLAHSYQRDILAVPGKATDPRSRGCNGLIKSCKAALVESADDVLYHLNWDADYMVADLSPDPDTAAGKDELFLLQLIIQEPGIKPDALSTRSGIPVHKILSILVSMELKRWISAEPGYRYHTRIDFPS